MSVQHFSGIERIKHIFTKTLECEEQKLYTILTHKPLVYLAGKEFAEHYIQQRVEKKIFLQSLRLTAQDVDLQQQKNYSALYKETKISHKKVLSKSLVIWDDFVAIIDVETLSCVLIENKENALLMKELFQKFWEEAD